MLKVDPKKKMLFNPEESIDFNGNTGPFIQYTYARIQSLINRYEGDYTNFSKAIEVNEHEKELITILADYKETVAKAAASLSPAHVANYLYEVVKTYNGFYQNNPILNNENEDVKKLRLYLSEITASTIQKSLGLLGIGTVNRM